MIGSEAQAQFGVPRPAAERGGYANEVEVEEGPRDAVLKFWRNRAGSKRTLVREMTVPLSVLADLRDKGK